MTTLPAQVRAALKFSLLLVLLMIRFAPAQTTPTTVNPQITDAITAVNPTTPVPSEAPQDTTKLGKVVSTVESFADFLLKYFVALAAVGALAMSIVELFKKLWEWRIRHYTKALTEWMGEDKAAYGDLLHLTTALVPEKAARTAGKLVDDKGSLPIIGIAYRDESSLFALELDQMMGHVQDAVDTVMNNPDRFEALYKFATQGASPKDIEAWKLIALKPPDPNMTPVEAKERADTYTRLHQIVKRRLDAFQLTTGRTWVNWNQFWANVAGFFVMLGCLIWLDSNGTWKQSWLTLIVFSLMGGVLSPVAKDIIIALKRVRGG